MFRDFDDAVDQTSMAKTTQVSLKVSRHGRPLVRDVSCHVPQVERLIVRPRSGCLELRTWLGRGFDLTTGNIES